jgi:hypothetical protein
MSDSAQRNSQDRRDQDRREAERRQKDVPIDFENRRSGVNRRIGSRRTGQELKFCSGCGKRLKHVPTIPTLGKTATTTRFCAECGRQRGMA